MKRQRRWLSPWLLVHALRVNSAGRAISKVVGYGRRYGVRELYRKLRQISDATFEYGLWVKRWDTIDRTDRAAIAAHVARMTDPPLLSLVTPVYNPPEKWLRRCLDSVCEQHYPHWEFCLADDASTMPHVRAVLAEYAARDPRIRVVERDTNGHISAASNSALAIAKGEFIVLLDHDDELPAHALYMVAAALEANPALDMLYSDEDKIDEQGRRFGPYFKPDWDPDLLTGQNLVSHLGVFRRSLVNRLGGFRLGYEGSQDWDLALRVADSTVAARIHHIPHVLYHWRAIAGSTAIDHAQKPYLIAAASQLLTDHFERTGRKAVARPAFSSYFHAIHPVPEPAPLVSIVIAGSSPAALARCLQDLRAHTAYPAIELIAVVDEGWAAPDGADSVVKRSPADRNALSLAHDRGAAAARGALLCFLHDGIVVRTGRGEHASDQDWLTELVAHATRTGGAAGPLIIDHQDKVAHAGWTLGARCDNNPVAGRLYRGYDAVHRGHAGRAGLVQRISALSGSCMVVPRSAFDAAGGFDAAGFPGWFADVDLCLKLAQAGLPCVWTPFSQVVELHAFLPATPSASEVAAALARYSGSLEQDPAHNPNLTLDETWPYLAAKPRLGRLDPGVRTTVTAQ